MLPILAQCFGIPDDYPLILSLRLGDFELFIGCLEKLCPVFFALDHTHNTRWISVFVNELKLLNVKHSKLFEEWTIFWCWL